MKKYYRNGLIGLCFAFLVGCQSINSNVGLSGYNLTDAVNSAFMNHPELAPLAIHIETQKGTVFLSGYVKTIRQSDTALEIAGKVPGVRTVQNGLIVRK
jgi:hyperosmotically inducible protein